MEKLIREIKKHNEKRFPQKCYVCMGDHAQDRYFATKKAAWKFLSNSKVYNAMMPCKGNGIL